MLIVRERGAFEVDPRNVTRRPVGPRPVRRPPHSLVPLPYECTARGDRRRCYSAKPCRYRDEDPAARLMSCGCIGGRPATCVPPRPLSRELILYARQCRLLLEREQQWGRLPQVGYRARWRFWAREYREILSRELTLCRGDWPVAPTGRPWHDVAGAAWGRALDTLERLRQVLTPRELALLWAYHVEGQTQQQIAARLGVSQQAVSKKLADAVVKARAKTL